MPNLITCCHGFVVNTWWVVWFDGDIWCVWGGAGTMDEPWCVFIGCYDSSFSNYRLFVNIICQLDGGVVIILTTSDPIICIVYKLHCVCVCVCVLNIM